MTKDNRKKAFGQYRDLDEWIANQKKCIGDHEIINQRDKFHPELSNKDKIKANNKVATQAVTSDNATIPLISHQIWFTNPGLPKIPNSEMIKWAITSMETLSTQKGWVHYYWVNDKKLVAKLISALSDYDVEFREISEISDQLILPGELNKAIQEKKFGMASDIFRYEVLRIYGGLYFDVDYELVNDPQQLHFKVDSYIGNEPFGKLFLSNAFIAFAPQHPVLNAMLEHIDRYISPETAPIFLKKCSNMSKTMHITSPIVFTRVYLDYSGQKGYKDLVLDPATAHKFAKNGVCTHKEEDFAFMNCSDKYCLLEDSSHDVVVLGCNHWANSWVSHQSFGSDG